MVSRITCRFSLERVYHIIHIHLLLFIGFIYSAKIVNAVTSHRGGCRGPIHGGSDHVNAKTTSLVILSLFLSMWFD